MGCRNERLELAKWILLSGAVSLKLPDSSEWLSRSIERDESEVKARLQSH